MAELGGEDGGMRFAVPPYVGHPPRARTLQNISSGDNSIDPEMTATPPAQTDLKGTLEEMRASVAARGARKGLAARAGLKGAIEEAFLGLLSVLLAVLEDFRAGRLAAIALVCGAGRRRCG